MEHYINDLYMKMHDLENSNSEYGKEQEMYISNIYINIYYLLKNTCINTYTQDIFKYNKLFSQIDYNIKIILNTVKSPTKIAYVYIDNIYPKIFIHKMRINNYNNNTITFTNDNIVIKNVIEYIKTMYPDIYIVYSKTVADKQILSDIYLNYNNTESYYILTTNIDIFVNTVLIKYSINTICNNIKYNNILFAKNIIEYIKNNVRYLYINKYNYASIIKNIIFIISLIDNRYINNIINFNISYEHNILGMCIIEYCNILDKYNMNIIENNNINTRIFIKFLKNINNNTIKSNININTSNNNLMFEHYFKTIVWFYKYHININIYNFNWNFINSNIINFNILDFIEYISSLNKDFIHINNLFISPLNNINILNNLLFLVCTNNKEIILKELCTNPLYIKYYTKINKFIQTSHYYNNKNIYIEPEMVKKILLN